MVASTSLAFRGRFTNSARRRSAGLSLAGLARGPAWPRDGSHDARSCAVIGRLAAPPHSARVVDLERQRPHLTAVSLVDREHAAAVMRCDYQDMTRHRTVCHPADPSLARSRDLTNPFRQCRTPTIAAPVRLASLARVPGDVGYKDTSLQANHGGGLAVANAVCR